MSAALPIDLRSDTVTRPTAGMRAAIAAALVGDDLYREDPTVNRLEEEVAHLLGKEAALFVTSGTLANQLALRVNTRPGDDALVSEGAHLKWYEAGAAAALAGVQLVTVGGSDAAASGLFSAAELEASYLPLRSDHASPPMSVLCLENTHNRGGGRVWPLDKLQAVCESGRRLRLRLHLDGARLWNAATALGLPMKQLAAPFDTVSVCLSKGLGAPVGSLLCGTRLDIEQARRYRRMYGGSMRQAGILAAAGLYALAHHVDRLRDDHANAQGLATALANSPRLRIVEPVETNIVLFDLLPGAPDAATLTSALATDGVLVAPFGPRRIRMVTHLDVDEAACQRAAARIVEQLFRSCVG